MALRKYIVARLYKSECLQKLLFNPLVEYHQWKLLKFVRSAAKSVAQDQCIIDVGAGELKYKKYFAHCKYVSNDLCVGDQSWNYENIDIVSSAYEIPAESESFDHALCIQVLEHLDRPERAFAEFQRILKKGGRLYLSAPLVAGEHQQPFDFYRYTRFGLASLGERHGLSLISIEAHGGLPIVIENSTWAMFWGMLPLPRHSALRYVIYSLVYPVKLVTGAIALALDSLDRQKSFTINYNAVYYKK